MLRRTRFALSVSESGPKPTRREWIYQWPLISDDFSSEDSEETEEYVQEWNFPYPGQKEFFAIDSTALVSISMPMTLKQRLQRGRSDYLKQNVKRNVWFTQETRASAKVRLKK